ncbi:MAG TPA: NAD-dependent epimerase/dehydratase family protein [Candidatus Sulfotelmatobacter sp.]|nr:NAD-dependent epimerase/dehydratase family protein [Candidatus Sulfotelmatobacter sp.]
MKSSTIISPSSFVLVTGGAGFIGSHLVERLLNDGKSVIIIDDFSTGSMDNLRTFRENPRLKIIRSKISKCKNLPALAKNAEFIFHLAATVGVELVVKSALHVLESSFHETEILLRAAVANSTPILLTSTSEVYGKSAKAEFSEEDDLLIGPPTQSRWSYANAKLTDEFLALACAREKNLPVIIARLFNTVGPRQTGSYGMVLPRFIASARAGKPLRVFGDGKQSRCFCLVHDVVESLVRLQKNQKARGEIFNIGGTEEVSILELAKLVVKTLGSRSKIELIPYDQAYAPGFDDMRRRKPRVEKLERFVNFKPRTKLQEIIRITAE